MILSAAMFILFSRYSRSKDVVIGIPFANRGRRVFQNMIGFFVNTLPIRIDLSDCHTFIDVIHKVRLKILGGLLNREMPFASLVETMRPEWSPLHNPLFQTTINHVDLSRPNYKSEWLTIQRQFVSNASSVFDLIISIIETETGCYLNFDYPIDLFEGSPNRADG